MLSWNHSCVVRACGWAATSAAKTVKLLRRQSTCNGRRHLSDALQLPQQALQQRLTHAGTVAHHFCFALAQPAAQQPEQLLRDFPRLCLNQSRQWHCCQHFLMSAQPDLQSVGFCNNMQCTTSLAYLMLAKPPSTEMTVAGGWVVRAVPAAGGISSPLKPAACAGNNHASINSSRSQQHTQQTCCDM